MNLDYDGYEAMCEECRFFDDELYWCHRHNKVTSGNDSCDDWEDS